MNFIRAISLLFAIIGAILLSIVIVLDVINTFQTYILIKALLITGFECLGTAGAFILIGMVVLLVKEELDE